MIILGIIFLYILSAYLNWKYTHVVANPKNGKRSGIYLEDDLDAELIIMLMPVINTIGTVRWIVDWPYKNPLFKINLKKFFKIED
jgi:hypothetical protein